MFPQKKITRPPKGQVAKVEKIKEDSLDLISSSSPWVKIQIQSLLEVIKQHIAGWCQQTSLTTPSNVLPLYLKQTFLPIVWIFTQGEEDEIKSKLSS